MVVATQLIFSLIVALIISWIMSIFLNKEGRRSGFFFFFLLVFLITYAGSLWIRPFGPSVYGVFWLPILFVSILAGLFIYRSAPRNSRKQHSREETLQMLEENEKHNQLEQVTYVTLDILFWLIISLLVLSILYRLLWGG